MPSTVPPSGNPASPSNPSTAQLNGEIAFETDIAIASGTTALPTAANVASWLWVRDSDTSEGPETDATAGLKVWRVPASANMAMLTFFGSDADGETGSAFVCTTRATVLGSTPNTVEYIPEPQALLAITLGAKTGTSGGLISSSKLWADEIVETTDYGFAPNGNRLVGPGAAAGTLTTGTNARVGFLIDCLGASHLAAWLRVGTAAGINAHVTWF